MRRLQTILSFLRWVILSTSLAFIDQYLKRWAVHYLGAGENQTLFFLNLELCYNQGVGFSLLADKGNLLLIMTTISFILILKELLYIQNNSFSYQSSMGLSLMLGGGLSNLYDRVKLGAIIDFISINNFFCKALIFNLADVLIVVGLGLVLFYSISSQLINHFYLKNS